MPAGSLLCRGVYYVVRGGRVILLPVEAVWAFPGIPSCSYLFPRGVFRDCGEVGHRAQGRAFAQARGLWQWSV